MTRILIAALVAAALLTGCGSTKSASTGSATGPAGATQATTTTATGTDTVVPANFAGPVDNPWFPLIPGTTLEYRGIRDGQPSRDVFTISSKTKMIGGVACTVVSDQLFLSGKLEERTLDYYAQDKDGNVWYFGEDTAELRPDGSVKSTEGTWLHGRDGAVAGIFMPADPKVGQTFRQEYYKGHAEDHFRIISLSETVKTPGASSQQALLTEEWTPLEPKVLDNKYYVGGIGTVLEQTVKGGDERNTLVAVHKG